MSVDAMKWFGGLSVKDKTLFVSNIFATLANSEDVAHCLETWRKSEAVWATTPISEDADRPLMVRVQVLTEPGIMIEALNRAMGPLNRNNLRSYTFTPEVASEDMSRIDMWSARLMEGAHISVSSYTGEICPCCGEPDHFLRIAISDHLGVIVFGSMVAGECNDTQVGKFF